MPAIVPPPSNNNSISAGGASVAAFGESSKNLKSNLMIGARKFFIHILAALVVVLVWAFICINVLSFTRPDSVTPGNKDNYTNDIFKELDLLFPDDTEASPYGFHWKRGVPDSNLVKDEGDDNDEDDDKKEKDEAAAKAKGMLLSWVNILRYKKDDKTSLLPYSKFAQPIVNEGLKRDNETSTGFLSDDGYSRTFGQIMSEWLLNGIYFSYGNSRTFIKKMFRWLNTFMINRTPSAIPDGKAKTEPDPRSDYAYMTNLMVVTGVPVFITIMTGFFAAGIGAIMMIVGSVINKTYHKVKKGGELYEIMVTKPIVDGFLMTLILGSFSIFPIAAMSYFIQPAIFGLKLLTYPITRGWGNFMKIFFEIVPMLVGLFAMSMCIAANYDFEEPFNYILIAATLITYAILFKDKIMHLIAFITMVKGKMFDFKNYNPDKKISKSDSSNPATNGTVPVTAPSSNGTVPVLAPAPSSNTVIDPVSNSQTAKV